MELEYIVSCKPKNIDYQDVRHKMEILDDSFEMGYGSSSNKKFKVYWLLEEGNIEICPAENNPEKKFYLKQRNEDHKYVKITQVMAPHYVNLEINKIPYLIFFDRVMER